MIELGTTVNRRYRIDREVGAGGMAVVFRGHDLLLGRDVAVKVLRRQYAADPNFRARFEREAQAAAGFAHANIIDIYDVGEEAGVPYIVMEFVRGHTLGQIIEEEGPFHPDDVASLLEQVCAGLDYAHERGYVHRDVKPQNILVDERGQARVADFGIAKGLADADLTEIGAGLGTVGYLSPEQASGLMATPASDVYSVGVVAFEMLTGRLPFAAETPVGVAMRHVHDPAPTPSSVRPGVPPAVDALVLRSLAKDPTRRFPSAGDFARGVREWRGAAAEVEPGVAAAAAAVTAVMPAASVAAPSAAARNGRSAAPGPPRLPMGARTLPPTDGTGGAPRRPMAEAAARPTPRDEVGCATWATGTLILVGLVVLVWLGFRLSPRLTEIGGPATTAPVVVPAEGIDPSTEMSGGVDGAGEREVGDGGDEEPAAAVEAPTEAAAETGPIARPEPTTTDSAVIPVPELIGLGQGEAEARANGAGLTVAFGEPVASDEVPVDAVARQEPAAGTEVEQGGVVVANLSAGSDRVDLAALGLPERSREEAEAILREEGLEVEVEEVGSAEVAEGRVVGSSPAGRVRRGENVRLLLSLGDVVFLPGALQGQPLEQARGQVQALGLRFGQPLGVSARMIRDQGVDLGGLGIEDGDVVGVSGRGVNFNSWVERGSRVDLVYYDQSLDR